MKDTMDDAEIVSSLVDDELGNHEVEQITRCMVDDKDLMDSWERYHLISDTLKKNLPPHVSPSFSQQISKAIENEPSILSPHRRSFKTPQFIKQFAGLGLAASVTAVAIFTTQSYFTSSLTEGPAVASMQAVPQANQFDRIALPQPRKQVPANIDKYLANHNGHASRVPGVLPYARIIGYSTDDTGK